MYKPLVFFNAIYNNVLKICLFQAEDVIIK